MMQIITADGCVWIPASTVLSVFRSLSGTALITLESGGVVAGLEPYAPFVERLNAALCQASGVPAEVRDDVGPPQAGRPLAAVSLRTA